jgi:hypothetical protein
MCGYRARPEISPRPILAARKKKGRAIVGTPSIYPRFAAKPRWLAAIIGRNHIFA